jgi:muconolactone delta-isomerase
MGLSRIEAPFEEIWNTIEYVNYSIFSLFDIQDLDSIWMRFG